MPCACAVLFGSRGKDPRPEDRREFLAFAESWDKLASEIERNEHLITLIGALAAERDSGEPSETQRTAAFSLRRLAAVIVSIPSQFGAGPEIEDDHRVRAG